MIPAHEPAPGPARGSVAALGNFDGVHAGHRAVLNHAAALAAQLDAPVSAAVFKPHPRRFFKPDTAPFRLMSDAQRVRALEEAGAARVFAIPFDRELAGMTPEAFVERVLAGRLGLRGVVTGADFRFGKDRAGGAEALRTIGAAFGITAETAPEIRAEARKVSSTGVREALQAGDAEGASKLLGRPFAIEGEVIHGDRRGRTLGFPTANIALGDYLRPAFGVYAVRARIDGETVWRPGVANLGRRPTVDGADERLEAHLFDFHGDLYGRTLEVALDAFIRGERRFDGLEALTAQIAADSATARARYGA